MAHVTCSLPVVFSPLLLWQASPSSLLSASSHGGELVMRSLSLHADIAVCFCIVCIKLFLVFLLSLEF